MERDDEIATYGNIFLGLSSINSPLIASEKGSTTPPPTLPFSSTLYIHSITRSHFVISRSLVSIPPGLSVCRTMHPGSSLQIGWFVPRYACAEYEVLYYTCYYNILISCMGSSTHDGDYTRIYTQIPRWCCTSGDLCSRENQDQQQLSSLQIFSHRT
jgi:hypothetical protein